MRFRAILLTEAGLARLALGIAALHVADDNFFQPEPGTSACWAPAKPATTRARTGPRETTTRFARDPRRAPV